MKWIKVILYYLFLLWLVLIAIGSVAFNFIYNTNLPVIVPIIVQLIFLVIFFWGAIDIAKGKKSLRKMLFICTILIYNIIQAGFMAQFRYEALGGFDSIAPLIRSLWGIIPIIYYLVKYTRLGVWSELKTSRAYAMVCALFLIVYTAAAIATSIY